MTDHNEITITQGGGCCYSGPKAMEAYRAIVIASGLKLYAATKILPSRQMTPTRMLQAANQMTGHNYRRGQYSFAAAALIEHANKLKAEVFAEMESRAS